MSETERSREETEFKVQLTIARKLLRNPLGQPPEWFYIAINDEDGNPVAIEREYMQFIVTLTKYLERKLHGG